MAAAGCCVGEEALGGRAGGAGCAGDGGSGGSGSQLQDPAEKVGDLAIAQSLQNWIVYHQGS